MSSSSSSGEANEKASSSSSAAILSPNVSSSSSNVLQATSQPVSQAQAEDAAKVPEVRQVFEIVYNELALRFPDEQFKDFRFPPDDVVIEKYLKQHRTNQARLPPLKTKSGGERLDPYVKVCYQCFSADWKLVKTQYTRYFRFQPPKTVFELAPEKYFCRTLEECFKASVTPLGYADQSSQTPRSSRNAPNSRTSMQITRNRAASSQGLNEAAQQLSLRPDDPHFQYVQPWTPRTDEENRREREQFRLGVFDYYDPDYDWKPGTEISICNRIRMTRKPGESKKTKLPFYFKFQPIKITMELGDYEPFFCTVALYDIGSKKKISENFDFNCNPEHLNAIVAGQILPEEVLCESKTALFAVTKRNKNIFMLVEIFKVLHGDNEVSVDPYAKIKEKEGLKADKFRNIIRTEATDYCQRLGRYRQLFGWTAIQVFDIKGSLVSEGPTQFKQVFQRNPRDEPIEFLTAFSTKDTKKMGKELFGTLDVNLEKVEQEQLSQLHCLDPSLQPVIKHEDQPPAESTSSSSSSSSSSSALGSPPVEGGKKKRTKTKQPKLKDLIVEVHEFPQDPNLVPNFFYVNNMYIYPTYLNFNSRNARNIAIKMQVKASDVLSDPPLNCIYTSRGFVSEYLMPVQYHNKTPQFHDEIKIALPPQLSESHHLVFTFYHINCQTKKKKEEVAETEIASGFVPLYPDGRIVVHNQGNHHAIALTGKLEDGYLSKPVHLIDGGKQLFQMYFSLVSTIYPEDASISKFLHVYHTSEDEVSDESLIAALNDLRGLSEVLAVQYLPVIINNLLEVMTRRSNQPSQEAFKSLIAILHKVKTNKVGLNDKLRRASLLELYSSHVFDQTFETRKPVYYPLCQNFLLYMMEKNLNGGEEDSIFVNSWFIFDLIIKSMTLELVDNGKLNTPNRVDILNADNSDNFTKLLFRVLNNLTRYFQKQISLGKIDDIRILNQNLALFIKDLFTIFDRGVVIDLIKAYLKEMNKMSSDLVEVNTSFKFEFLQIIYDHEHLVALNLPLNSLESFDADAFDYNHPLSSVIINETINTMILNSSKASKNAVEVLYDVVVKIAYDARYAETDKRERVTATFFSLVRQLLENWSQLSGWRESTIAPNKRELYALLIYILKSSSRELVRRWWKQESNTNVLLFLRLFIDCIRTFEYNPKHIRPAKITLTPAVALFMTEVGTQEVTNMLKEIRTVVRNPEDEDHRLRALSQEVSLLILDLLEDFMVDYNTTISDHSQKDPIMDGIIDVYLTYLSSHQSIRFVHSLYASLRSFAHKYSNVLFHGNNSYVGDLCSRLLLHCNIPDPRLNIEASSLIYILLKLNQKETQSFGRTRIQLITSLSKLVNDNEIKEDVSLNLSFQRITQYALHSYSMLNHRDIDQDPHYENDDSHASYSHARFCRGIEGLSKTLSNILRDTLQLNELKQSADNHMIADLYKQIAEGYKNTPDLRVTWLRQLAKFQDSQHNYAEAAICNCHISALIADYLVHKEQLPIDLSIFTSIAPFISEFADDGDEGVCQSQDFTTEGFKSAINSAINFFRLAELFEFAAQLYKVITPLYERDHSYKDLSNAFKQLKKFWAAVVSENEHRLFGRYFRIGFYGRQFGEDIDGTEFVYKEPKLTHLLELSEKIKTFYTFKFNSPIQIIDSSANISALDPSQCCIQITYVDPFFDDPENRTTFFSKNNGLVSFYFDTPFTKSGKAQGSVADQFMRKTVLSVQESFPNMVTRLPVQSRREIITTPIENAINNVEKRCLQIEAELANTPINHKTLQQILQGSVRLQVNEGAISICKVFLVNFLENPRCHIEALCFTLRRFLDLCRKALAEDLKLTDTLQMPFHQEMEAGFAELKYELERYLSEVNLDAFAQEESGTFSESFNEQDEDTVTDFDDNAHDDSEPSTSPSFSSAISSASSSSDVLSFPSEKRARSSSAKEASSSSSSSLASELSPKPRRKKTPLDHIKEEEGGAGSLSPKKRPRSTYLKKSGEDSATSSSEALPVASESTKRKHRQSLEGKVAPVAAPIASSSSLRASQPIPPPIIPPPAASAPLNSPIVAAAIASAPIPMPIMEITSPSPRKPLETFKDTGPRAPQSPTISLSLTRLSSPSLDEEANKEQSGSVSPGSGLPKPRDTPPEAPKSPKKRPQPPPPSVAPPAYVLANRRPVGSDSSSASSSPSTSPAAVPAPKPKEDEDGEF